MRRTLVSICLVVPCALLLLSCTFRRAPVLHLVPVHAAPELMAPLAKYYREQLGMDVQVAGAVQADSAAFDRDRRQLVGEEVIRLLRERHPVNGDGKVIAITSWDMYIRDRPWRFAFSWRSAPYAVVSYARMNHALFGAASQDRVLQRLRKMVTRNVGILAFRLRTNDDRTSLMYQDIMGVDELDRIDEDLARAGFRVASGS